MKQRWISLLLVLALLVSMTACTGSKEPVESTQESTQEPTMEPTTEAPEPTAHELFAEAAEKLKACDNVTMEFKATEQHAVWRDSFLHEIEGTAVFEGLQNELVAKVEGSFLNNDSDEYDYSEFYFDGKTYATLDEAKHKDEAGLEAFLERQYPVCLFDAANFETGQVWETSYGTRLTFSDVTALEEWIAPDYAVVDKAEAEVFIGEKGIETMSYTVSFQQGAADITMQIETKLQTDAEPTLQAEAPADAEEYVLISNCWAPRVMERAICNLNASESSSGRTSQVLLSSAVAFIYTMNDASIYYAGGKPLFKLTTNTSVTTAQGDQSVESEQSYKNGILTVKQGDQSATQKLDDESIEYYMHNFYNDYFMLPEWITECEVSAVGDTFLFEFGSEDETCLSYFKSQTDYEIFSNESPLDEIASAYEEKGFSGYMGVDPDTWLPTSYGIEYEGMYTIEGQECEHSQKLYSKITGADPGAYKKITDEQLSEEKPEEPPTPVFYHVTGEDGSEMWLLGTIHVGDERTAYLPQEIYDAFDASDALAVEFNMNAYEDEMESNEDLQDEIISMYTYEDESEVVDHLDEEVYEAAVKFLKGLGEYHPNLESMKPFVWESSITGALKDGGRRLFSDKGVDQRLLDRAEAAEKEILDVESAEFQVGVFSGFSDELQEYLLASAMSYTRSEYNQEILELFEMWCAGDEEALRAYINNEEDEEELEEMDEEERALYEEYQNAISTERDVEMIEVAKGYLQSGKTVFYAVGLAHLLMENGLVDGLRAAGYTVELVEYKK